MRRFALLALAGLCGCGGPALDATNVDTLEHTFRAMIADMPELERERLAGAILSVHEDSKRDQVLSAHLPTDGRTGALFVPDRGRELLRQIALSSGKRLNGKTAKDLLTMQEEIAERAAKNQDAVAIEHIVREAKKLQEERKEERRRQHKRLVERASRLERRLAELESQLTEFRSGWEAAKESEARALQNSNEELAILNGLQVKIESQVPRFDTDSLRSMARLTFENGTQETIRDAKYGYEWSYGDCSGYRESALYVRLFKEPLGSGQKVTVESQLGLGLLVDGVIEDESGHRCALSGADEYEIVGVRTAGIRFGSPSRMIERADVERSMATLRRDAKAREEQERAMIEEIQTAKAVLRGVRDRKLRMSDQAEQT